MRLVLLGAPGTGKGTQSALMVKEYGVPQISTGDMFRAAIAEGSEIGLKVREYAKVKGTLVPDDVVIEVVRERLQKPDTKSGFIFDGFPRTVAQAGTLEKLLDELNVDLGAVLFFKLPREEILKRLNGRRICKKCGAVYNVFFDSTGVESDCREGGKCELIHRPDDKIEVIEERLRIYKEQTEPLVEFYRNRGMLIPVEASGTTQQVFDRIKVAL
jgi:adenylate kinase